MLLIDSDISVLNTARKVVVISSRESLQDKLSQLLRSHGIEFVEVINQSILSDKTTLNIEEVIGVIIDAEDVTDEIEITERINAIVPQHIWCCVVGDSDSISLAQKLLEKNILYFNCQSQINLMVNRIISNEMTIPTTRNTVKICVLGCKGGAGASFLASQIADRIAQQKKVPVLLAQGDKGSRDLDLLFDQELSGEIAEYNTYLDLLSGDYQKLTEEEINKYNFIIYDQPIFSVDTDNYVQFFDLASTFVLVVDRQVNSLRVAKRFLEQAYRTKAKKGQLIRVFVCVIDSRLEYAQLMSKGDIERLLNTPVDMVFPFLKKFEAKTILDVKLSKQNKHSLNELTLEIIGASSRQVKKEKASLFKLIWNKLISE